MKRGRADHAPLNWTPFSDGNGYCNYVWGRMPSQQQAILIAIHGGATITPTPGATRAISALVHARLVDRHGRLTQRGADLAHWARLTYAENGHI